MANRKPPNNYNVEQALLGAMIISPTALSDCLGVLNESDFFDSKNKIVFCAMLFLPACFTVCRKRIAVICLSIK